MNPILSINTLRPASVRLDTVTQTQEQKVHEAERKKTEQAQQTQQTQQTAFQETPAAEYTPGTTASAYPVGQDEGMKRKVFVDPVTVPGTLSAKISQDEAEAEENDHEVQVAERIDRVTQANAMADRIAPPAQRQEAPEDNEGFMTQRLVTVRTTAKETPAEKAIDPVYQNAPPVETQQLDPQLTQSTDVKDTITEPKRASEREDPAPRSVDRPRARRERPEIRPAPRKPREVEPVDRAEEQESRTVEAVRDAEEEEPFALKPVSGSGEQEAQAVGTVGGTEGQEPQAVGGTGTQQPEAVGATVGTGARQPEAVGTETRQPQAVGQVGNNPQEPQAANQAGTAAANGTETDAQKAAKAEEDRKAEQAEKTQKDQKAQEEKKAQQKEQTEKDQKAEKARKAEELKKKRTAAAKKIKQDMQRLKAQIVRERNPKTAEELSIQLVQMNAKLRQVNPGEQVSLLFK